MSLLRHLIPRPLQTVLVRRAALASHSRAMQYRQICHTHPRHADIPKLQDSELLATLQHTKFFKEIQANPEVRDALVDAVKVLQEEGFDINKPSKTMLITNSRVREQMMKVVATFQTANIDLASAKEAVELVSSKMKRE